MKKPYTIRIDDGWVDAARNLTPHLSHLSLSDWMVAMVNQGVSLLTHPLPSDSQSPATSQPITQDSQDDEPNNDNDASLPAGIASIDPLDYDD
jgi:hypothetical protein